MHRGFPKKSTCCPDGMAPAAHACSRNTKPAANASPPRDLCLNLNNRGFPLFRHFLAASAADRKRQLMNATPDQDGLLTVTLHQDSIHDPALTVPGIFANAFNIINDVLELSG